MADADSRSSLLDGGLAAGYDGGFFVTSEGGEFHLVINGQVQVRYVFNHNNDDIDDTHEAGFQLRRLKLAFSGRVGDPGLEYKVQGAFSRKDGDFEIDTALIGHQLGDGWKLLAGVDKAPFLREEGGSSKRQQATERSFANKYFTVDKTERIILGVIVKSCGLLFDQAA